MLKSITLALCASQALANRNRRQTERLPEYEGDFPGLARRSIITAELGRGLDQNILRRYVHMEKLINFYDQSISNITKYWTYGCWCFQMGDYPLRIGNGAPMDNVDKVCKRQKECYQCVKKDSIDNGRECIPEETGYKFKATYDAVTGKPSVRCINKPGTCQRNMCECDRDFASKLPEAATGDDGWTGAHHAHYGGFDSRNNCLARIHTGPGQATNVECCGSFPNRYPYRFSKDGSGKQCCSNSIFNTDTHQCCDGTVRSNGSC